jgi:hypothetical protein
MLKMLSLNFLTKNIKEEILDLNMKNEDIILEELLKEVDKLIGEGYEQRVVENAFWDLLMGNNAVGSGIIQTYKKAIFGYFIEKLGVDPKSFMGNVLTNAFANVEFKDYYRLVTDCNFTTDIITKTLLESFLDQWRNQAGFDSMFHTALKEVLVEALASTSVYKGLSKKLHGFVCPLLKEISSKIDLSPLKKATGM